MTVTEEQAPRPVRINLLFNERAVRVPYGVTLFDAASWNGIAIDSTCGGHGTCKKCRVRIADDPPTPSSLDIRAYTPQEIKDGWRLACRTAATRDTSVEVPPLTTRPKAATVGVGRQVILRPAVQKRYLELAEPDLADQVSDLERVLAQLDDLEPRAELPVLKTLGQTLRAADYKVTAVVVDDVLIAVEPGDTTGRRFGIAFDLGTTTVAATLLDLSTGTPVAVASALNKQQPFGADVITRISATMMNPGALDKLQQLAQETLAELAAAVCADGGVRPDEVYEVALAGNATMTHLALGIDPEPLGMAPFILSTRLFPEVLAADLALPACIPGPVRWCSPPSAPTSAATSRPACWPAAWTGTPGSGCSSTSAPTARSCWATGSGCWPPPRRPARLRGRRDPVRHARRRRRDRGGRHDPGRAEPEGHRRRRAAGSVRIRPGRRGDRAGQAGPARFLRPVRGRGGRCRPGPGTRRPADPDRPGAGVRAALAGAPGASGPGRRPRTASTCPSATSASCSSPRPRSRPAGTSCSRRPA